MEEEFLVENLKDLKFEKGKIDIVNDLIDALSLTKSHEKSKNLRGLLNQYTTEINKKLEKILLVKQVKFVNDHPEIVEVFPELKLNYLLESNDGKEEFNVIKLQKKN